MLLIFPGQVLRPGRLWWKLFARLRRRGQLRGRQTDGNLVLYSITGTAVWNTKTWDHPGAYLQVQDDCNLIVYHGQIPVWWTGTTCH